MGQHNLAVNQMLERKDIFADFMNGIMFQGREILKPEALELLSAQSGIFYEQENSAKKALERRGDIRMKADIGTYSIILANETQHGVHYAMPIRSLLYDALEYTKQVQALEKKHKDNKEQLSGDSLLSGITKNDRLTPVITTILFFGSEDEWDGCRSLYEMLDIDSEDRLSQELQKYLPDYKLNLIFGANIENPEFFHTCLQYIFGMLKYNKDKKRLYQYVQEHKDDINRMDSVELNAAFTILGEQKRLAKLLEQHKENKEGLNMCKAIDDLIHDGEIKGKNFERNRMNRLTLFLAEQNRLDDIVKAAADSDFQNMLFAEFGL